MKVTSIGIGAMGSAIMAAISDAILNKQMFFESLEIVVTAKDFLHAKDFATQHNCVALQNNVEAINGARYIFIATKPQTLQTISAELKGHLSEYSVIVSMMAGVTIKKLQDAFGTENVIRIMPNIASSVGCGLTAISPASEVSDTDTSFVKTLLKTSGLVSVVDESLIDSLTCVSGSAIAFLFVFAESLADASVKLGIKRSDAYRYAAQTMLGAAKILEKTQEHPAILKDKVCSPAGTTIEGISTLEKYGFRNAIISAVDSMYNKCKSF